MFNNLKNAAVAMMANLGIMQARMPDAGVINQVVGKINTRPRTAAETERELTAKHGTADGRKLRRKAAKRNLTVGAGYRGALLTWASEQAARRLPKQHGRAA